MKTAKLSDMTRGWFIGDFEPSILKTSLFEVGILTHKKGEHWPKHYHRVATEYNVLLDGVINIAGQKLSAGDVFWFDPGDIADPEFIEDCRVCVVKIPSVPGDKHEIL